MRGFFVLAVAALAAPFAAQASAGAGSVTMAGRPGGIPMLGYEIASLFMARALTTFVDVSGYDEPVDASLGRSRASGGAVGLDPLGIGVRLSAGARAASASSLRFNSLPHLDQLSRGFAPIGADVRRRSVSPLVTVGYAQTTVSNMTFGIDAGAMFRGRTDGGDSSATTGFANDLSARGQLARQDGPIAGYDMYPVVQLSMGYSF